MKSIKTQFDPAGVLNPGRFVGRSDDTKKQFCSFRPAKHCAFDAHHPPSRELLDECVHCGFCLATCPTYALWGNEMDSPRGRIYLMSLAAEGQIKLDSTFVRHMDNCLGCMACVTACPSGVKYDKLIQSTRAQIERNHDRPLTSGLQRRMIFQLFPRPDRLRWLLAPMRLYQRSGLQSLVRKSGSSQVNACGFADDGEFVAGRACPLRKLPFCRNA